MKITNNEPIGFLINPDSKAADFNRFALQQAKKRNMTAEVADKAVHDGILNHFKKPRVMYEILLLPT